MDEHSPPASKPPPPPIRLDYATPDPHRPAGGASFLAEMVLGFIAFVITLVAAVASIASLSSPGIGSERWVVVAFGAAFPCVLIASVVMGNRGFRIGVLIGLGLAVLGLGLCVAAVFR